VGIHHSIIQTIKISRYDPKRFSFIYLKFELSFFRVRLGFSMFLLLLFLNGKFNHSKSSSSHYLTFALSCVFFFFLCHRFNIFI
jgi:hypothetical protein